MVLIFLWFPGRDQQECGVSHLLLGRPDWAEGPENLRLVRTTLPYSNSNSTKAGRKTTSRCVSSCCVASYHCHLYPHPENDEERADVLDSLRTRIQDLNNVGLAASSIRINNSKHETETTMRPCVTSGAASH